MMMMSMMEYMDDHEMMTENMFEIMKNHEGVMMHMQNMMNEHGMMHNDEDDHHMHNE